MLSNPFMEFYYGALFITYRIPRRFRGTQVGIHWTESIRTV